MHFPFGLNLKDKEDTVLYSRRPTSTLLTYEFINMIRVTQTSGDLAICA